MKNKGLVIGLTLVITLLSVYYLSFTFVARSVQQNAIDYATDKSGIVSLSKKQTYLDSIWNIPVYNLMGTKYTYKEVKENELSLGLDLQGGMHVTLEISPVEIIKTMANNSTDPAFLNSLRKARNLQLETNENFSSLFFKIFRQDNPGKRLSSIFANPITKGRIASTDDDSKIIGLIDTEIEQAIDRSFTILRNRIDEFGTSQPNIQRLPGTGRIQIEIPGADNPQRVRKLLQGVARLEFFDVVDPNSLPSLYTINDYLVKERSVKAKIAPQKDEANLGTLLGDSTKIESDSANVAKGLDSLKNNSISPLFALSQAIPFRYDVKDTSIINSIFKRPEIRGMLPRNVGIFWAVKPEKDRSGNEGLDLYFLDIPKNSKAKLTGDAITDARSSMDELGNPGVSMSMSSAGTRIWKNWTAAVSNKNPKGRIAIVLDNSVYSAPTVQGEIPNGNSQISGNFTSEEARDLANILKAGSLPAPATIVEEAIIGPTLGKVAQSQGMVSICCGLGLVIFFMVAYYGKSGAVANLALIFNLFFILGILAQLDASLTLPGIAGVVLTMGMAVDANVIIYERIREELRRGARLREALALGYKKSFSTIFDSNITTFLTALMLYIFGQGPIKGFAITLMVGIVTTFFTAVYISRVVIEWIISRRGDQSNIAFYTIISKFAVSDLNINFISKRKIAYAFSAFFIGIGIVLITLQGLNLGVDFTGGRSFIVNFNKPIMANEMKVALTKSFENAGTEVKNYGGNNIMKVTTSYLISEENEDTDEKVKTALIEGIGKFNGMKHNENASTLSDSEFAITSSAKVGATIADDIKAASVKSTLFSLVAIFFYILVRFRKWQFSTGAIVSLAHDALFVFAAFAIAKALGIVFEVDQVFIAAILTVIGYSINDTVIIFDRIREYLGLGTSHDYPRIFNDAINSTLNRTLITSGTTLLVVLALFIFGGEVLRGFSFALLVGIGIGTYSSVFIAAPIVLDLDEEEKGVTVKRSIKKTRI
jgi:SecD/SecF fusion protein